MYEFIKVTDDKRPDVGGAWFCLVELTYSGSTTFQLLRFESEPTNEQIEAEGRAFVQRSNDWIELMNSIKQPDTPTDGEQTDA